MTDRVKISLLSLLIISGLAFFASTAAAQTPQINRISPSSVQAGESIRVIGEGFASINNKILFSGPAEFSRTATHVSGTLYASVPLRVPDGDYTVRVQAGSATSNAVTLTVSGGTSNSGNDNGGDSDGDSPDQPTGLAISNISPNPVNSGDSIVITGSGFANINNRLVFDGPETFERTATKSGNKLYLAVPLQTFSGTYNVSIKAGTVTSDPVSLTVNGRATPAPTPAPTPTPDPDNPTCNDTPGAVCLPPSTPAPTPDPDDDDSFRPCIFGVILCPDDATVYTALGDSIGVGASASRGYVPRYADFMEDSVNNEVQIQNRSRSGWTSSNLLSAVSNSTSYRNDISEADFITINIGGNDLRAARTAYKQNRCGGSDNQDCLRNALATFKANWDSTVSTVNSLKKNGAQLRTMDVYYPFVTEDVADESFDVLEPYWRELNSHIILNSPGFRVAHIATEFNGGSFNQDPDEFGLMSFDGFHPNDRGHAVIAEQLTHLGF